MDRNKYKLLMYLANTTMVYLYAYMAMVQILYDPMPGKD